MRSSSSRLLLGVCLLLLGTVASAQEDRTQQALARAQGLLRQVSAQKQELEAANARLTQEVEALKRQVAKAEAGLRDTEATLAGEKKKAERGVVVQQRLERTEGSLQETRDKLRTTTADLRQRDGQLAETRARIAELEGNLAEAERKNLELYGLNVEILELYRNKSPMKAFFKGDPITGLVTVEVENTLQEYRVKLEDAQVDGGRRPAGQAGDDAAGTN